MEKIDRMQGNKTKKTQDLNTRGYRRPEMRKVGGSFRVHVTLGKENEKVGGANAFFYERPHEPELNSGLVPVRGCPSS